MFEKIADSKIGIDDKPHSQIFCQFLEDFIRHATRFRFSAMVRGVFVDRAEAGRMLLKTAIDRYLREVSSTKKLSTASTEKHKAKALKAELGDYSLAALNPNLIAEYRDQRLADSKSPDTVRLELALLSHLFTIAIKEWRLGLVYNPVMNPETRAGCRAESTTGR